MNRPRLARCLRLLCVLAAEAAAVVALDRLGRVAWLAVGWHDLAGWLRVTPAEDALAAVLRSGALAAAWWLLASTVLCLLARLSGLRGAVRLADGLALPVVRRLTQRVAAVGLSAGLMLGQAATAGAEPVVVPPDAQAVSTMDGDRSGSQGNPLPQRARSRSPDRAQGSSPGQRSRSRSRDGAGDDRARPRPARLVPGRAAHRQAAATDRRAAPVSQRGDHRPADRYRVRAGDHLWAIAQRQVAVDGADDSTAVVADYWLRLVEAATPVLRSGDPDVIHPGELIALPPLRRP